MLALQQQQNLIYIFSVQETRGCVYWNQRLEKVRQSDYSYILRNK